MGMRACLAALEDKSLPSFVADAEAEVAADLTGVLQILIGHKTGAEKRRWLRHY
jgi:hypothetical protein